MAAPTPELPRQRLSSVVAEHIQRDVLSRGMQPGDKLPTEAELAEQYQVSRAVVREAGRILDGRGLVDIRPGRGMTVSKPDGTSIANQFSLVLQMNQATFGQLMQTRLVVEVEIAALAATNRSDEDLAELRATLDRARDADDDYEAFLEEDLRFHELISRASGNPYFSLFIDPVNECLRNSYTDAKRYLSRRESTFREHEAIVDAIEAGDADQARAAARAHLERVESQQWELVPPAERGRTA